MSYSTCLKCNDMVEWYNKYCKDCIKYYCLNDDNEFWKSVRHLTTEQKLEIVLGENL